MTPTELEELADELQAADAEELLEGDLLERVVSALREAAREERRT